MPATEWVDTLSIILAAAAAVFSLMVLLRASGSDRRQLTQEIVSRMFRDEADRIRSSAEEHARGLRQELSENVRGFQDASIRIFRELSDGLSAQIAAFGDRLDVGIRMIDERTTGIGIKFDDETTKIAEEANRQWNRLHHTLATKFDEITTKQAGAAKELREEMSSSFRQLGSSVGETLNHLSLQQKERLENVTAALGSLTERQEKAQEALRGAVEGRLDVIRSENAAKLDEIRATVDDRLQTTLESRLGESFNRVVEQLERVYKGIGEMQTLAAGVGDLKKLLSNVRVRGTFGEVQLAMLLEQFLSPEQILKNVQIKDHTQERVEFAIRLPGRDGEGEVLLPIDAKFPQEDWERLAAASDAGDTDKVADASRALENRIKCFAKSIREKYISPPKTTDFAILFLPTESLYAEVLRRPGFFEQLQREYHVTLAGPTTFTALLNALQVGFRSLAIEKRSSEVWQILGAVRTEFGKYNEVVDRLSKQLNTAAKSVSDLGVRTRAMDRKLRDVERLPEETTKMILDSQLRAGSESEDDESIAA